MNKINLTKGGDKHSIDLSKTKGTLKIHANLNWGSKGNGFLSLFKSNQKADLDLGCMYQLQDGTIGVIQPLGGNFGSAVSAPYIHLDKDDRNGNANDGENMNVYKPELIKKILFFAFIYEGASDFTSVNATMFFKLDNGEEVNLVLDNAGSKKKFCAAALITNNNGKLEIQKEAKYFDDHKFADEHYKFGFQWVAGSK